MGVWGNVFKHRLSHGVVAATAISVGALLVLGSPAALGQHLDTSCNDVELVFARGSGQALRASEAIRFFDQVGSRLGGDIRVGTYELGSEAILGDQYPAVAVGGSWDGFWHSVGAAFTGGGAYEYGWSVDEGARELEAYLSIRSQLCSQTRFVLGGYSQGAQVIGEAYDEYLPNHLRDRIVYQALFGDPKLYLPEGAPGGGIPACVGGKAKHSAWRFDVPDCRVWRGSLEGRRPYLPVGYETTTGLSCAKGDFICSRLGNLFDMGPHEKYANAGGSIDKAAVEVARRLEALFPNRGIDTTFNIPGAGTSGIDVVFVVDSTGSMLGRIDRMKTIAADMAEQIHGLRGRVALVEYRDKGDLFTSRILSGLQEDPTEFLADLSEISARGGGDAPEALLHALMTAFNGLDWRDGATKAAIVLTDQEFHNPDLVDGTTLEDVAKRALEIDPVNVYSVVPGWYIPEHTALAEATSGRVIRDDGNTAAALLEAVTMLKTRPVALLPHPHYYADPGQTVTFDASASYSPDSQITRYDWDYDGDGVFEEHTTTPTGQHAYPEVFDGVMQVKLTDANGNISNASAFVSIGIDPYAGLPTAAVSLSATHIEVDSAPAVQLTWESDDASAAKWGITLNGVPIGMVAGNERSAIIHDVVIDVDAEYGVIGFTEDGWLGQPAAVLLPAKSTYSFSGFQNPVQTAPALNVMNAGRSIPMKFGLGGDFGLDIFRTGFPASVQVQCESSAPLNVLETTTAAGASSLSFSADGTYNYVWKTDSSWAGTCRVFRMVLDDGSTHEAIFKFR